MQTQFVRDQAIALIPTRTNRWCADSACVEAERDPARPETYRHVPQPRVPIYLTSDKPSDIAREAEVILRSSREASTGKKMRISSQAVVSRVMSYPVSVAELGGPDFVEQELRAGLEKRPMRSEDCRRLLAWTVASVKWSKGDLGAMGAALIHLDEANPHIHHVVPLRRRSDLVGSADLSFWKPAAAEMLVRQEARDAGVPRKGRDVIAAGRAARLEIMTSYHAAVGSKFGHAIRSDDPRKRRKRREHLERRELERELAETKADLQIERERVAALESENATLRARVAILLDQGRALATRARLWIGAMRGDPAAVRDAGEAPTLTECRIDATLGVGPADIQRRRQAAV